MSEEAHHGGCMCGAVRYEAAGAPLRVGICHCETCRRNTGAPYGAFAIFDRSRFRLTSGRTAWFGSSPEGKRHFCGDCGSPIFCEWTNSDDVDVFAGTLDEPERFAPDYELWTVRRLPGYVPSATHRQFDRNRT